MLHDVHRRRPGEPAAHRGSHRVEHVELHAEEVAEHLAVNELHARDEARDVARCGRACDVGLVLLERGFGDEHALEEVCELEVERGVPE